MPKAATVNTKIPKLTLNAHVARVALDENLLSAEKTDLRTRLLWISAASRSTTQTSPLPAIVETSVRVHWPPFLHGPSCLAPLNPGKTSPLLRGVPVAALIARFGIHKCNLLEARG